MVKSVLPQYPVRPTERIEVGPQGIPALLVAPETEIRCPGALIQHGYGSTKEDLVPLAVYLAAFGFVSILPDAWGHGERFPASGPNWMNSLTTEYLAESLRHTIEDMSAILPDLIERPEVQSECCLVAGFSMGAMAALVVGMEDPRVCGIISVSGSPLPDLIAHPFLGSQGVSDAVHEYAEAHDVTKLVESYAPRPLLLQHGRIDDMVPVQGTLRLYESAKPAYAASPDRLALMLYEHTHLVTQEEITDAVNWIVPFFHPDATIDVEPDEAASA